MSINENVDENAQGQNLNFVKGLDNNENVFIMNFNQKQDLKKLVSQQKRKKLLGLPNNYDSEFGKLT